jgi:purine-binding chemotaxis protein CheW
MDKPENKKDTKDATNSSEKNAILKQRAEALAVPREKAQTESQSIQVLVFTLGPERFGVRSETVREVCPMRQVTRVPCVPSFVIGIINIRGKIFSILDIRRLLNLPEARSQNQEKVIIIGFEDIELGILADDVCGVQQIAVSDIQQDVPIISGLNEKYLFGITADRLTILNVAIFLSDQSIIVDETV